MPYAKNPIQPGDGDPRHGSVGGYTYHGCRCPDCRRANTQAQRDHLERKSARLKAAGLNPFDPPLDRRHAVDGCLECTAERTCYYHQKRRDGLIAS